MEALLKQQIKLSDGSYDNVFSKFDRDGQVFFDCFVCRVGRLPGLINATVHARGKRHVKNLSNVPDARSYRDKIPESVKSKLSWSTLKLRFTNFSLHSVLPEQSSANFSKPSAGKSKDVTIDSMNLHLSARNIEQKAYAKHKSNLEFDKAKESIMNNYSRYRKTLDSHPKYAE